MAAEKSAMLTSRVFSVLALMLGLIVFSIVRADPLLDAITVSPAEEADRTSKNDKIETNTGPLADLQIEERLEKIFSELDDLNDIEVNVQNSVVELTGEVAANRTIKRAKELASQIEGVVEVKNLLEVSLDVTERINSTWDRLQEVSAKIVLLAPLLILSIITVIIFWLAGSRLARQKRWFQSIAPNTFIAELLANIVRLVTVIVGIILALYLLDATSIIGTVLGAAGIVGLAVGFAVRDTVENYIASILLSLRNPFAIHDYIRINEHDGSVARLTSRATILISADGNKIRIPNAIVFKSIITNYTERAMRRFSSTVPIDESGDLIMARQIALDALRDTIGVCDEPAPLVLVDTLGEAVISLKVYGWVNQQEHHFSKVQTAALSRIKLGFKAAGIVMPESVHTVRLTSLDSTVTPSTNNTFGIEGQHRDKLLGMENQEDEEKQNLTDHPPEDTETDQSTFDQVLEEQHGRENLLTDAQNPE